MNVELVTIGNELLLGFTIDSNAAYLASHLAALGVAVTRRTTCSDDADDITDAVRDALRRTGAVITTGGLGPTADDRTREGIAQLFGRPLLRDEHVAQQLRDLWARRGRPGELPASNYAQAMVPDGARVLPNAHGSAPGLWVEDADGRWVAMLPGVPSEMRAMATETLLPLITERVRDRMRATGDDEPVVIASKTVRTTGVAESVLAERLGTVGEGFDGMSLAFLPGIDGVDLRLTVRGLPAHEAERRLAAGGEFLREILGDAVYGEGDDTLAREVIDECRRHNVRLAVAESCTGGLLGARITSVPGASDIFHGGLIAYDNRVKRQLLGVLDEDLATHGAVSEPVALQMAKGIRVRLGTEMGISITGIAGPSGGTEDKPVGTVWIALDVSEGRPPEPRPEGYPPLEPFRQARVFRFIGDRDEIRHRATQAALDMVRRALHTIRP